MCLEFDIWYNECYLNGTAGNPTTALQDDSFPSAKSNPEYQFYDDAAERFERMQKELLLSNLDSMPFRQAQMRTNRRVSRLFLNVFFRRKGLNVSFSTFSMRQRLKAHGNTHQQRL